MLRILNTNSLLYLCYVFWTLTPLCVDFAEMWKVLSSKEAYRPEDEWKKCPHPNLFPFSFKCVPTVPGALQKGLSTFLFVPSFCFCFSLFVCCCLSFSSFYRGKGRYKRSGLPVWFSGGCEPSTSGETEEPVSSKAEHSHKCIKSVSNDTASGQVENPLPTKLQHTV